MSIGYGNPPRASRFKKGQSGNQKGPPRGAAQPVSTSYLFRKIANEQVEIEVQGRKVAMTYWEALLRQNPHFGVEQGCERGTIAPSDP